MKTTKLVLHHIRARVTTPTTLTEHIKNHTFVRLASVCKHFGVPINPLQDSTRPKDWITIGVLAGKSPPRTTTKGDKYCVIKLTDLKDTTVNLFLFRDVWKAWWKKLMNGMVVAILNPKILKPTEVKIWYHWESRKVRTRCAWFLKSWFLTIFYSMWFLFFYLSYALRAGKWTFRHRTRSRRQTLTYWNQSWPGKLSSDQERRAAVLCIHW